MVFTSRVRLCATASRYFSNVAVKEAVASVPSNIRNIGIVAHIDAGKTTVTERLLYLSGAIKVMGDVDSGSTVTDFLELERERGITIQSAAVSFDWNKHRINLVDTPGHVDFTVEVERSLRVMDGIVTVLDGSAGVQAQTLTVWRQAAHFALPSVVFINKMDKPNANFDSSIDSIEQRLGCKALPIVVPLCHNNSCEGFIDVLRGDALDVVSGEWKPIKGTSCVEGETLAKAKEHLYYSLADNDSSFMEKFLESAGGSIDNVSKSDVEDALLRCTNTNKAVTVSSGSALRWPTTLRSVLNQVIQYLPSPCDRHPSLHKILGDDLSAVAFKIGHDKRKGRLSYVRIYSGTLKNNAVLFNANRKVTEKPLKLFVPFSDEMRPVSSLGAGNIGIVSGLSHTMTGDSLFVGEKDSHSLSERISTFDDGKMDALLHSDGECATFAGINYPVAVFFCSIEPPAAASSNDFNRALEELSVEDPSMRVRTDVDSGETILETMGELHLEVIKDRLRRNYGLDAFFGPLQVSYREIITEPVEMSETVEEVVGDKNRVHSATLSLKITPISKSGRFKKIVMDLPPDIPFVRHEWMKAINEGCSNALQNGPTIGFPVHDVEITLTGLKASGGRINTAILSACAQKCVQNALSNVGTELVEPVMKLEVHLEQGESASPILQELTRRHAVVEDCSGRSDGMTLITATLPLAETTGLSRTVRVLSSGMASLHLEVAGYRIVSSQEKAGIVNKIRSL